MPGKGQKNLTVYAAKSRVIPYMYQLPTILLLALLMLLPIIMVIRYSLYDNVIMNQNPVFVGLGNYISVLKDETFRLSLFNTLYFTVMSVIFHLVLGTIFALLLNSRAVHPSCGVYSGCST
jgi:multiple sugar transport system permease protein